jgi:predicted amidophosphoribosyltransferase
MGLIGNLLNILFPPRCVSCKKEGVFICPDCIDKLKQRRIHSGFYKSEQEFKYLDGVIYAFDYAMNPAMHNAIHNFKYKYNEELKTYFGLFISKKLSELSMIKNKKIILIPVPLHPKRLNERGFNQAELITREIQKNLCDKVEVLHLLKRSRYTSQQAKLSKKERHVNLEDAFIYCGATTRGIDKPSTICATTAPQFAPRPLYFIVDDVCTTGATLENCAKILKKSGIKKVYGLTIARAFK